LQGLRVKLLSFSALCKAGIPPAKALQIATFNAARLLKQENELEFSNLTSSIQCTMF